MGDQQRLQRELPIASVILITATTKQNRYARTLSWVRQVNTKPTEI